MQAAAALVLVVRVPQPGQRGGVVEHLADQPALEDEPEADLALRVTHGVGHQLGDQQFGRRQQIFQAPAAQRPADEHPGPAGRRQFRRQRPADHVVSGNPAQPRDEQRNVVTMLVGVNPGQGRAAQVLKRHVGRAGAEDVAQPVQALVDVTGSLLDQAVGVEHKQAAIFDCQQPALDQPGAHPERRGREDVEQLVGAVRPHQQRRQVAGRGDLAGARHRIEDRVHAGSEVRLPHA